MVRTNLDLDCRCEETGGFCKQELPEVITATECLTKAKEIFRKGAHVACMWGNFKIGYHAHDGSWIVCGRGKSWKEAYQNAFGIRAVAEVLDSKFVREPVA